MNANYPRFDSALTDEKSEEIKATREEILKGIGFEPLTFPASLHVPEALRDAEDRSMQDYIVAWTQGLWDHINKFDAAAERHRSCALPTRNGRANTAPRGVQEFLLRSLHG